LAKLIVNPTSPQRQELSLPRTLMSIGRDPSNDLVLPDAMVSRRHAVIELRGTQYYLRDCNSSNGSLVNGDRISERSLRDGDLVAIGTARLLFREDVEALDPAGKIVQHPSAPRLRCVQCGTDYRRGDQFCKQCGGTLQAVQPKAVCTACGTAVPLPARFCNACGGRLAEEDAAALAEPAGRVHSRARAAEPEGDHPGRRCGAPAVAVSQTAGAAGARAAAGRGPDGASGRSGAADGGAFGRRRLRLRRQDGPAAAASASAVGGGGQRCARIGGGALVGSGAAPAARGAAAPGAQSRGRHRQARSEGADLGSRLLAGALDLVAVGSLQALLLAYPAYYWWSRDLAQVGAWPKALSAGLLVLTAALGALYFIYFWGVRGATPGKRLLGLDVEGSDESFPIGLPRASARLLGYLLSGALLGGGFLLILLDGNGLHDHLAGTRVVRRRK
jgi:uncharacterized RDD family membrane protein YckC/predicted nucleic acid-binding Zn ribbon protein